LGESERAQQKRVERATEYYGAGDWGTSLVWEETGFTAEARRRGERRGADIYI
jgi:hypothetical protein